MARESVKTTDKQVNFLESPVGLVLKTCNVAQSLGVADGDSKIVPAGTIIPSNDGKATGILFEAVDVTHGDHEGSAIIAGRLYKDLLPTAPASAAETALKDIRFFSSNAVTRNAEEAYQAPQVNQP